MMRQILAALIFLLLLFRSFSVFAQEETENLADSYLEELDIDEIQADIDGLFPELHFSLKDSLSSLIKGEIPVSWETIKEMLLNAFAEELKNQKNVLIQILILAVAAAVFFNFVRVFEKNQISDVAFYMIYLMMFVILMRSYGELDQMAGEYLEEILHFMKLLLPVYLAAATFAAGSVTAAGFYELTLLVIAGAQLLMDYLVLPGVRLYVLFLLLNHLGKEDYFSKLAGLVRTCVSWTLKTMLMLVLGVQTVQSLLFPAIDSLKNSIFTRATGAVPVLGNTLNAVTETVLGTALVLKNAVGVAGLMLIALISLTPVAKLACCALLYKAAGAAVQPVSDRRITECVSGVGEGAALLLKAVGVTAILFLVTLAIVTASIRNA